MADASLAQRQTDFGNYIIKGYPKLGLSGWPMASACAVVGNGTQENLCRPVTPGVKDHGSDGVMQWRLVRLTDMQTWCVKNFGRWDTLEAQAAFTMYEVRRDYPILYTDMMMGSKKIETLTANFCNIYERPAVASAMLDQRIKYAEDAHALLVAGGAPATSAQKVAGATVVTTAGAVVAAQANGLPGWASALIIVAGIVVIIGIAILEAQKPHPAEPTK